MEGNDRNNTYSYLPDEIPIPGAEGSGPSDQHHSYRRTPYLQNSNGAPDGAGRQGGTFIVGAVCAFLVLLAIAVGAVLYIRSTPGYKLSRGFRNLSREIGEIKNPLSEKVGLEELLAMMRAEGSHVESKLDFSTEFPLVGTVTLGIDTDFYKDMEEKALSADTSVSVRNYEFAHVNIYANQEVVCFSIPELFLENLYIENENVVSQFNRSIFAQSGYASGAEDFTIDLFGGGKKTIVDALRDFDGIRGQLGTDIDACRDAMVMEKEESGLYRVVFPAEESDRLVKKFVKNYDGLYGTEESLAALEGYDRMILSDVSLLFALDRDNRIESILLEEPVKVLDGSASLGGELFFQGEKRSIDRMQGKLSVDADGRRTREVSAQVQLTPSEDVYRLDVEMTLSEEEEMLGGMKLAMECDAARDRFELRGSLRSEEEDLAVDLEGSVDDIVQGESLKLELEKAEFIVKGEDSFRVTGDVMVELLRDGVKETVRAETAFFGMSWSDWGNLIGRIAEAYGGLLDSLW